MTEIEINGQIEAAAEAVAIIGMAGRFPQAKTLDEFWENLKTGREVISVFSEEELLDAGVDAGLIQNPDYVPARAILDDAEMFDAAFFGYNPREAETIDPQQRFFLECAWEALENAGCDPERYPGSIGVFGGLSMNSYLIANLLANPEAIETTGGYQVMLGNDKDFLTTRLSYKLNLKGPSYNIQTACSTSLVAVHLACHNLLSYQCDMALAGGVSISSPRIGGYLYKPGMILSPDGHCRPFDQKAQGIVPGEGVGIVVLKRLSEALREGDSIHAIIRGGAINNDGALKVGYTAPSVDGQTEAILTAQTVAGIDPRSITYIETHGTGTELGDPIEIKALTQAFRAGTADTGFCSIGSVKSNMGHLDAAAGIAGLIKTVLSLKHKMIVPSLNFEKPNPRIDFAGSPFYVNAKLQPWDTDQLPRRAGVSSFGIGGTNAHLVLEEGPQQTVRADRRSNHLVVLSAKSNTALDAATRNLITWMRQNPRSSLADIAYTLQTGRKTFAHRRIVAASTLEDAVQALETLDAKRVFTARQESINMPVAFLFPGQGSQHVQMGRELYDSEPVFRDTVDYCANLLEPYLSLDLRAVLYPEGVDAEQAQTLLLQTKLTQPALFTIEYALAKLWISWGLMPQAMIGHSIGEYVAACLAGVFSLEDALALVAERGRLMQGLPGGSMLAVPLGDQQAEHLLTSRLSLAVINGPQMCVISGPDDDIEVLHNQLTSRGVDCRRVHTSHAFHSAMMDPILPAFHERVSQVKMHAPAIPYLSNMTGTWITAAQAVDPQYWTDHLRSTVRFSQNLEVLFKDPWIMLEVGPGQVLSSLARQHPGRPAHQPVIASMRHPQDQASDNTVLTTALGRLWLGGGSPDWAVYHSGESRQRIPLPTYPFERKRFWVEPMAVHPSSSKISAQNQGKRKDVSTWFYQPAWQRTAWPLQAEQADDLQDIYLIFSENSGFGLAAVAHLEGKGNQVVTVLPGSSFQQISSREYVIAPDEAGDYISLFKALDEQGLAPNRIIHAWLAVENGADGADIEQTEALQEIGFYSLLWLAQALANIQSTVDLLLLGSDLFEVTGTESICAGKATALGALRVIPQELPHVHCRVVDISSHSHDTSASPHLIERVIAEFNTSLDESFAAHRGAYRWMQSFTHTPLPEAQPSQIPLRKGGVYLITGGMGGIGFSLAEYLAREYQAKLILVARTALPARSSWESWISNHDGQDEICQKIARIQKLESYGAQVMPASADVTNFIDMKAVIDAAQQAFGPLNGVIHAAGVAGGGIIQLKTKEAAARIIAPKLQGTLVLSHLLLAEQLDFMLLCSSINGIIGAAGQVDYSAANAYLDAFAIQKNHLQQRPLVIAVNWFAWQDVGMAFNTAVPEQLKHSKKEVLNHGIHSTEGVEALTRILANPASQVIVSPVDLFAALENSRLRPVKPLQPQPAIDGSRDAASENNGSSNGSSERPNISTVLTSPETEIQAKIVDIWEDLLGIKPIGIHDNFFELGGHSLLATQILSRIRTSYQIDLPLRTFFEVSTAAEISKLIEEALWLEQNSGTQTEQFEGDREELEL